MKSIKRMICMVMALAMLLSLTLTGCSAPKLTLGGTPAEAGTVDGEVIATGEYLAYLYDAFYNKYYNNGYYMYSYYGYDVWTQDFTYGEGDDAQTVKFSEYLTLSAKDSIVRQAALRALLKKYNLEWNKKKLDEVEKELKELDKDAMLPLGISDENYINVNKQLSLNEYSLFFGLYGEGGEREVSEADRRAYFEKNYLSYKIISIALTDSEGKKLDDAGKKKITDQLDGYLKEYNKTGNFEKVVDAYNKSVAEKDAEVTASKDEDNRKNVDATQLNDEYLAKAIRTVDVGKAKVVTYDANGSTPTAALILRLDINDPKTLFADETENILYGTSYEAFEKELDAAIAKVDINLKKAVTKKCKPENFISDVQQ